MTPLDDDDDDDDVEEGNDDDGDDHESSIPFQRSWKFISESAERETCCEKVEMGDLMNCRILTRA